MLKGPKLTLAQWEYLTNAFSNISQAIIIFSLAAIFVPEVVNLSGEFPQITALGYLAGGLISLGMGVIMSKKGK